MMKPNTAHFVCPKTQLKLLRISGTLTKKLNILWRKNRPLSAIWLREDGEVFYPERNKIPILMVNESVAIAALSDRTIKADLKKELERWIQASRP